MAKHFSRLRSLREARGLRQIDVVFLTHLSPATIWIAEHGDSISLKTRKKIAKVLKVRPEDIWPDNSHEAQGRGADLPGIQLSASAKK